MHPDSGKFMWPSSQDKSSASVTRGQLSMLMEGIDWRNPKWSSPPKYGLSRNKCGLVKVAV